MNGDMCYVGKFKGQVVAVTLDDPENRFATAEDVAQFIRQGYTVERITCEEANRLLREAP